MSRRPPKRGKRRKPPRFRSYLPPELAGLLPPSTLPRRQAKVADMGMAAVAWMLAGERDKAVDVLEDIIGMGPRAVHGIVSGWAMATLTLPLGLRADELPAEGHWGITVEDERTGEDVGIGKVEELEPGMADAARLLACAGNRDQETIAAIVESAWADETGKRIADLMWASLSLAVMAVQREGGASGE